MNYLIIYLIWLSGFIATYLLSQWNMRKFFGRWTYQDMKSTLLFGLLSWITALYIIWDSLDKIGYRFKFIFAWYDLWIGFFWDSKKRKLYILPLPMVGLVITIPNR